MSGGKVTMVAAAPGITVGIFDNSAVKGGGIYLSSGTLTVTLSSSSRTTPRAVSGGAILSLGTVVITNSVIKTTWPSAPTAAASTTRAS